MENQPTTHTQPRVSQKRKPIVSPISPLSSYKSVIIVLCAAILFWMLLQGGNKREIKDIFRKRHETPDKLQSTVENTKDTVRNSYDKAAESTKTTFQNVADKMKNIGDNMKSMYDEKMNLMHESAKENKEYLKDRAGEAKENIVYSTKTKFDNLKEKSQEAFDNVRTTTQETVDRAKEKLTETQNDVLRRLDMVGLVEQSYSILQEFFAPNLKMDEQIPVKAFSGSKAVIFLTVVKGGIGLTGVFGSGIIVARNEIGHWSGPCALALVGVDIGLNIGVERSNHIIILRDDNAIRAFTGKGQFKFGIDAAIAVGPKGRDASAGFSVGGKGYAPILSYSLAKGAYIGLSFEGQVITLRDECNEQYYGTKAEASKILDGTIKPPKNKQLTKIYKFIDEYAARNLVYPEHNTDL